MTTLLMAEKITVSDQAQVAVIEEGMDTEEDISVKITFRMDALSEFVEFLQSFRADDEAIDQWLLGKQEEVMVPIDISVVVYFNGINNRTFANTDDGQIYIVKYKLYQLEERLAKHFIRINKSEIVNIRMIERIVPMFKGKLILYLQGYKTPFDLSRNYAKEFKERLGI